MLDVYGRWVWLMSVLVEFVRWILLMSIFDEYRPTRLSIRFLVYESSASKIPSDSIPFHSIPFDSYRPSSRFSTSSTSFLTTVKFINCILVECTRSYFGIPFSIRLKVFLSVPNADYWLESSSALSNFNSSIDFCLRPRVERKSWQESRIPEFSNRISLLRNQFTRLVKRLQNQSIGLSSNRLATHSTYSNLFKPIRTFRTETSSLESTNWFYRRLTSNRLWNGSLNSLFKSTLQINYLNRLPDSCHSM